MGDAWVAQAACLGMDTEAFFAEKGDWVAVQAAKTVCADCPVRKPCLDEAMADPWSNEGIRGGTTERERSQMRSRRHRRAA